MKALKSYKNTMLVVLVSLIIGFIGGRRSISPEITVNEVIKEKIVTQIRTVKSPDGTVIIDETKTEDRKTETKAVIPVIESKWHISADVSYGIDLKPLYGLQVERKVLGPMYLGVRATTAGTVGIVLGATF